MERQFLLYPRDQGAEDLEKIEFLASREGPTMTAATRKYLSRKELGDVENLCEYCSGRCCKYFAMPIDTPDEAADLDFIRWYLLHEKASVFVEDDTWYLLVHTGCKFLGENNRCGIYEIRPQICRDYSTDNCEFEESWTYDKYFETPEQIAEYSEAVFGIGFGKGIRSARPKVEASEPCCCSD